MPHLAELKWVRCIVPATDMPPLKGLGQVASLEHLFYRHVMLLKEQS